MMENRVSKKTRVCTLLVALMMMVTLLPTFATAEAKYGCAIKDDIFFRASPSKDSIYWDRLKGGWVVNILGTVKKNGVTWYRVKGTLPKKPDSTREGYVHGDFFRELTAEEAKQWEQNPVQGTIKANPPSAGSGGQPTGAYIKTNAGGLNLRKQAATTAQSIVSLPKDTVLAIVSYQAGWYYVMYGDDYGYIEDKNVRLMSQEEVDEFLKGDNSDLTQATVETPLGGTLTLRKTKSSSALALAYIPNYTVLYVTEIEEKWTTVNYNGKIGYVWTSCLNFSVVPPTAPPTSSPTDPTTPPSTLKARVSTPLGGTLTLRETPSTSAKGLKYIPNNTELTIYDHGDKWSYAEYDGARGYVLSVYLVFTQTPPPTSSVTAKVNTPKGGPLTLRETPSTKANALANIPNKTSLIIIDKGDEWCLTSYNGKTGYVLTSYLVFDSSSEGYSSYIFITQASTNVRDNPAGNTFAQVKKYSVHQLVSSLVYRSPYTWYPISVNDRVGYVRSDCVIHMTNAQADAYFANGQRPSSTPKPDPDAWKDSSYIITLSNALNIRAAATTSSTSVDKVGSGVVIKYTGKVTTGRDLWYKIDYLGASCFVMGKFVRVMSNAEYDAYQATLGTPTPSPAPTPKPDLSKMSDLGYSKKANIIVRKEGKQSGAFLMKLYEDREYMKITGRENESDGYTWYQVVVKGKTGWLRGDLLYIMTPEEKKAYIEGDQTPSPTSAPDDKYVKYSTLRLGSSGDAVRRMQEALVKKGFLAASQVTGHFLSSTKSAVIRFQAANNLVQDGLAGQKTLATLYGTPIYDTSGVDTKLYPVEKSDWYKGIIQRTWLKGKVAVITDVKTGLSFNAKRWSGGAHADVEPLNASDTAVMCKIYGVSSAQEIEDRNMYQRRALWVTVGGHSFAASMYGVPHNYPAGDTLPNNNYRGQFCVHFTNSKTHRTERVDPDHQKAIQYAYDHAPSKK